jgi:hypothetical protein
MASAVVVLLPVWYVVGCLCIDWCDGRGVLPEPLRAVAMTICVPLDLYCQTKLPGAQWLLREREHWMIEGIAADLASRWNG